MATCGYLCPQCEGKGFLTDAMLPCDWCSSNKPIESESLSDQEWIDKVHGSNCCSDIGNLTDSNQEIIIAKE